MKNICIILLLINSFLIKGQDTSFVIYSGRVIDEPTYQALSEVEVI